ncbi:MAG TPA: VWA domain-containing protein [Planktothrix sp. UBA10369]|nr:VWA domain-containing protein [Planktothrix sp. UBA10369]
MPLYPNQPFWRYGIFQFFAILTVVFLVLGLLTSQLILFQELVTVQIALDLSSSTYEETRVFRGPGTIMQQEIKAVKAYIGKNATLAEPNLLSVSGFADQVIPITQQFTSNPQEIEQAIEQVVKPGLDSQIGGGTHIDLVVENGLSQLKNNSGRCPKLLVITDGEFDLAEPTVNQARNSGVKLNFLIVGQPVTPEILNWASQTGGIALNANPENISKLLTHQVFNQFNRSRFTPWFLGFGFISLMWMLLLPLDRLIKSMKIRADFSGIIAVYHAIFWTVVTPLFLLFEVGNPFARC